MPLSCYGAVHYLCPRIWSWYYLAGQTQRQTDTTASTCFTVMLFAVLEANWKSKMTDIAMDYGHCFTHLEFHFLWLLYVVFNKSSHLQICKVSLKHYTHMWRNQLKRSNKKDRGRKRREQYVCEEVRWESSAFAEEHSLLQERCPLHCVICHHILYLVLCYIISMQKAMILYNKHLLQGMSIQSLLIPDTRRMMLIREEHYEPVSRTRHSNQLPTGCN